MPLTDALPKASSESYSALLEAIVRSTDDAIITKNLSSIITSWNPAATAIFGWEAHEMIGHSVVRLIPQRLQYEEKEILNRLRAGERIEQYETRRLTREGGEIDVSLTISPLRNARGETIGAIKIARNVTELRAAERARLRLAAIVESSEDAIAARDLEGTITSWNGAAERMFGYSMAELAELPRHVLVPEELRDDAATVMARLLAGQRVVPFETVRVRKTGERVPVSISVSAILSRGGEVTGVSEILRDISQQREMRRSMAHAESLAAATRIAADIAHHVNNPLESLMNLLFLARSDAGTSAPIRALLQQAEGELHRLAQMARRSLDDNRRSAENAQRTYDVLLEALKQQA